MVAGALGCQSRHVGRSKGYKTFWSRPCQCRFAVCRSQGYRHKFEGKQWNDRQPWLLRQLNFAGMQPLQYLNLNTAVLKENSYNSVWKIKEPAASVHNQGFCVGRLHEGH